MQGKATVRAVDRKTDFACFDIELPVERADNVVIGAEKGGGWAQLHRAGWLQQGGLRQL